MPARVIALGDTSTCDFRIEDEYDSDIWQSWSIEWINNKNYREQRIKEVLIEYFIDINHERVTEDYELAKGVEAENLQDLFRWLLEYNIEDLCEHFGYSYDSLKYAPIRAFGNDYRYKVVKFRR